MGMPRVTDSDMVRVLLLFSLLAVLPLGCSPDAGSNDGVAAGDAPVREALPGAAPTGEVPYVIPGTLVENAEYAARRQRLMDEIPDGIAIIPGATSHLAG